MLPAYLFLNICKKGAWWRFRKTKICKLLYGIKVSCCVLGLHFSIHVQHWKLLLALSLYCTYVTNGIFHKFLWFMGHVVQHMGKLNVRTMFSTIFIILMMYAILLGSKNSLSTRQKYHQNSILKHYCYFSLVSVTVLELICIMIREFSKTLQFHCQVHNFFYK